MRDLHYILVDGEPRAVDLYTWAHWFESENHSIRHPDIGPDIYVSTAFLGIDHNFSDKGPPILFETMIFGAQLNLETWRYATLEQARAGHDEAVRAVFEAAGLEYPGVEHLGDGKEST